MKVLVTLLLLTSFASLGALAQGTPPVRRWEATDFGGERQAWNIASAPDGTIAVANGAGLLLFDGVRWRRRSVPSGQVLRTVIYHAADSSWWAGGYNGWWRWSATDRKSPAQRITPPGDPKEEWWHVLPDPRDSSALLWQSFSRLVRFDGPDHAYTAIPTPGNILFARTLHDTLFLPVINRGLYYRSGASWLLYPGGEAFAKTEIAGLAKAPPHEGSLHGLLVATRNGSLQRLRSGRAERWPATTTAAPWEGQPINAFVALRSGGFALATAANGLYLLSDEGRVSSHIDARSGLGDDTVLSLHEDRNGGLWVGLNDGLAYLSLATGISISVPELGPVYDVLPTPEGLLLCTNEGLFLQRTATLTTGPVSDITELVWHVTASSAGVIAGTNQGTYLLDASFNATRISTANGGWTWLEIDSTLALAGTYIGLERYTRVSAGPWVSAGRVEGMRSPVRQLYAAPTSTEGRSFYTVHPQEGLSRVTLDDSLTRTLAFETLDTLPGHLVKHRTGLTYYTATHTLSIGAAISGATGPAPLSIEITPWGSRDTDAIWATATLKPRLLQLSFPGESEAFAWPLQVRLDHPMVEPLPNGSVAVGLHRGYALVQPHDSFRSFGTVPRAVEVETAQGGNGVEVRFAQARYDRAPLFRIRLAGSDTSFTAWAAEGEYAFPQLKPGDYALDWESDDGQSGTVRWEIAPAWHQRPLAYIFYGLLIGAGFWALRVYYRRRLATQQRQADVERERQLQAERLRARAARLEDEVKVSHMEVELSRRELALRQNELEQRNRELAQSTLAQARHNESLIQIKEGLASLPKSGEVGKTRRQLNHVLEAQLSSEEDWVRFDEHFDAVHVGFLHQLHGDYPALTPGDLRLAALLRMNLPSKEIAPLLHLSVRGVENKRYRLRKKLELPGEANLTEWILSR